MTFISNVVVWMGNNGSQFEKKYAGVRNLMSSIIVCGNVFFANRISSKNVVVFAKCYLLSFHQNTSKREVLEKSKWDLFKVNATPLAEFFRVHICTSSGFKQKRDSKYFFASILSTHHWIWIRTTFEKYLRISIFGIFLFLYDDLRCLHRIMMNGWNGMDEWFFADEFLMFLEMFFMLFKRR